MNRCEWCGVLTTQLTLVVDDYVCPLCFQGHCNATYDHFAGELEVPLG